jgi:hypothetical protein
MNLLLSDILFVFHGSWIRACSGSWLKYRWNQIRIKNNQKNIVMTDSDMMRKKTSKLHIYIVLLHAFRKNWFIFVSFSFLNSIHRDTSQKMFISSKNAERFIISMGSYFRAPSANIPNIYTNQPKIKRIIRYLYSRKDLYSSCVASKKKQEK